MKANPTRRRVFSGMLGLFLVLLTPLGAPAFGQEDAEPLIRLRRAGFDERTLETLVAEKTLETAAFSVDELVALKHAGFKASTLQALLKSRSFIRNRQPIVYGAEARPIRLASVGDLIELKRSGISDTVLEAIVRAAGDPATEDRENALRVLEGLEIRIDRRPLR